MVLTPAELEDARKALEQQYSFSEKAQALANAREKNIIKTYKRLNKEAIIAVHLTDTFPEDGIIYPTGHYPFKYYREKIYFPRETIHFTLNSTVSNHTDNKFNKRKYAILIPLKDIYIQIFSLLPSDTFILGRLKLTENAEILGAIKNLRNKNPGKAKIIPIEISEEQTIESAVYNRIKEKGYVPSAIGGLSWSFKSLIHNVLPDIDPEENLMRAIKEIGFGNDPDSDMFLEFAMNTDKERVTHYSSIFKEIENFSYTDYVNMLEFKETGEFKPRSKNFIEEIPISIRQANKFIAELNLIKTKAMRGTYSAPYIATIDKLIDFLEKIKKDYLDLGKKLIEQARESKV